MDWKALNPREGIETFIESAKSISTFLDWKALNPREGIETFIEIIDASPSFANIGKP